MRESMEDQAREGVSLDNQRAKIKSYAEIKDLDLVEIIEDAGISAKNLNRRESRRCLKRPVVGKTAVVNIFKFT